MICLPDLLHRIPQVIAIMSCTAAVWLSTSCDGTNHNLTEPGALGPPTKSLTPRFVPHEVLVKFKSGVSQERIASIFKSNQADVMAEIQRGRLYHVRVLDDRSVESVITRLTSYPEVEYAEPNYRYETQK